MSASCRQRCGMLTYRFATAVLHLLGTHPRVCLIQYRPHRRSEPRVERFDFPLVVGDRPEPDRLMANQSGLQDVVALDAHVHVRWPYDLDQDELASCGEDASPELEHSLVVRTP